MLSVSQLTSENRAAMKPFNPNNLYVPFVYALPPGRLPLPCLPVQTIRSHLYGQVADLESLNFLERGRGIRSVLSL